MNPAALLLLFLISQDPVQRGMSGDEVRRLLGVPGSVSRQVLHGRYIEQWRYPKIGIWVHLDGEKGQDLRVRNVHPPAANPKR